MASILHEKLDQAQALLGELGLDAWLIFVRESGEGGEPSLPLVLDCGLTWQSALIVTRGGDRIAIVGKYDDGAVRSTGVWTTVVPYVNSPRDAIRSTLSRIDPRTIAINYSTSDFAADGLTHGMFLALREYVANTPYARRFVSAEEFSSALRGRKSPTELARIQAAVDTAQHIFLEVAQFARPGRVDREISDFMLEAARRRGVEPAWKGPCPIVQSGPHSMQGHGSPSGVAIEPGHILHLDFGVKQDGYCSDMQRCWYVPRDGETQPPAAVRCAFDAVVAAICAAASALKPGVPGWEVDAVARQSIVTAGYPEYEHALGHHVGRSTHDGGSVLGPQWERYGVTPMRPAEAGNVFTLEPSIEDAGGCGCLGLEEMVVVTNDGCQWLSDRQKTLPCLG